MSWSPAKLALARKLKGLTQAQLATIAGVGLATVQNIELGKANPALGTLEAILKILGFEIAIRPRGMDWESLSVLGVPLLSDLGAESFTPRREVLIEKLNSCSSNLEGLKNSSREGAALLALFRALEDHFPSVWRDLDSVIKAWTKKNESALSPKLRRLALQRVSRYL